MFLFSLSLYVCSSLKADTKRKDTCQTFIISDFEENHKRFKDYGSCLLYHDPNRSIHNNIRLVVQTAALALVTLLLSKLLKHK